MDDMKGVLGFVTGFIMGSVAGVLVGILLAPQSGEETREVIRERGIELKSRAEDLTEEGRIRFQEAVEEGKSAAAQKKEELTKALESEQDAKKAKPKSKKSTA